MHSLTLTHLPYLEGNDIKVQFLPFFFFFWWILLWERVIRRRRDKSCPGSATNHYSVYKVIGSEGDWEDFPRNQQSSLVVQQGYCGSLGLEREQCTTNAEYSILYFKGRIISRWHHFPQEGSKVAVVGSDIFLRWKWYRRRTRKRRRRRRKRRRRKAREEEGRKGREKYDFS